MSICTFVFQMTSYQALTDLQLIDQLKKDDEGAFTEIYRRYANSLSGFASAKLYNLDDARDIIHDVFVKLWQERKQLQITSSLKSYLFTITRYAIVDKIRKNITQEKYAEMLQALRITYEAGIEQMIAAKEIQQNINKSLDKLSPRVKEIFKLSREEHLSIAEIAEKLQISEQTVKNQLTSALKYLKQSLLSLSATAYLLWLLS